MSEFLWRLNWLHGFPRCKLTICHNFIDYVAVHADISQPVQLRAHDLSALFAGVFRSFMASMHGYEVKDDEEQSKKLLEIIELLVASGYFRARIKGLSPFDKVVGGMVWCISVCNYDIDVDLLFQENATIGQKIPMTEKIVDVLKEMKCPHHLEPHQIQGLDFIHIYSVVQWLVKKAIESKKDREDYNRSYAVSEFNKMHSFDFGHPKFIRYESALTMLDKVKVQPERKYKYLDNNALQEESQQVRYTLLEYGKSQYFTEPSLVLSQDRGGMSSNEDLNLLFPGLSSANAKQDVVSSDVVELIVSRESKEITKIISDYDDMTKQLKEINSKSEFSTKNSALYLKKQIENLENILTSLETQKNALKEELSKEEIKLKEALEENSSLEHQIQECSNSCQDGKLITELEEVVALNEKLKMQETEFRTSCMAEKKNMEKLIENLTSKQNSKEQAETKLKMQAELSENLEKLGKLRLILAKKNREISALRWQIDDIPSREELHQYQCRFIELHNQVSSKHKETKQFYMMYNTSYDIRLYLDKEVGLLNSILDNFDRAMTSDLQKATFMKQFEQIVEGVKQNKIKVERKQQEVKTSKAQLQEKLSEIVEKQRKYFKVVKDFQEECRRNEIIMNKLQCG